MFTSTEDIIDWFEPLPVNCPPQDSSQPNGDSYFRLVESIPPSDRDFWSHRKLYPDRRFNTSECTARACSVVSDPVECAKLLKLPTQRNKKIVELKLLPESGVIKQTGQNKYHYSWWRTKNFDPKSYYTEVTVAS